MFKLISVKDAIKLTIYKIIYWLVKCIPAKPHPNHLLLFKTDEIGDYVLIRAMLPYFKASEKYKNYRITFIGNLLFKNIYDSCDTLVADETIWINTKRFRRNFFYRFTILKAIRMAGASDAINLIYSRNFRLDDQLVSVSTATVKTGMKNDLSKAAAYERLLSLQRIYTILYDSGPDHLFDALRNAHFIGQCTGMAIRNVSTSLPIMAALPQGLLPDSYFIVFPGSGIKSKKWPANHFSQVARHVVSTYQLMPVVCGSAADKEDCDNFILAYGGQVIDLAGKTTLTQLLGVMKSARFLLSVDTGSVHLAAAVNCPVFALFSGLHYGRFSPYPSELAMHFFAIYPDEIESRIAGSVLEDSDKIPIDLLKSIPTGKVIDRIDKALPLILFP